MSEVITTQIQTEGDPAFPTAVTENDNSASSSEGEKTETDQTGSSNQDQENGQENKDGGNKKLDEHGFADHPAWVKREDAWKTRYNEQESRHLTEMSKFREEVLGAIAGKASAPADPAKSPVQIPEWFGSEDEGVWNKYQEHTNKLVNDAVTKAIQSLSAESEKEQKHITESTNYMKSEIAALESDKELNPQSQKVDPNKLLKFTLDNKLVDTEGRWNYKAAFKLMRAEDVFKAKTDMIEKKKLASATTSEGRPELPKAAFKTSTDFSRPGARPW